MTLTRTTIKPVRQLTELDKFRLEIAEETVERHPKANVETVLQMMEEMGF